MSEWIYAFGDGTADGRATMRDLLGGKGANLAEMVNLGLPVPPGFTITTEVCSAFLANDKRYPDDLAAAVDTALARVEAQVGGYFGDTKAPLLVSVRSGSRASMPGMMDTVLNLGLNDQTVAGLAEASGDARFAWDSYRRFIQMYGNVVLSLDHNGFEDILENTKQERGYIDDPELNDDDWKDVVAAYKDYVETELGSPFPQDPRSQLWGANWCGVQLVDQPACQHLPPASQYPRELGDGGLTCSRWCSETWATTAPPALPSRVTLRPVHPVFSASF